MMTVDGSSAEFAAKNETVASISRLEHVSFPQLYYKPPRDDIFYFVSINSENKRVQQIIHE